MTLLLIAPLLCLFLSIQSAPQTCSIEKCDSARLGLNDLMTQYPSDKPPTDIQKNMTILCQKTLECLTPIKCAKGIELLNSFKYSCLELEMRFSDFDSECLPEIFTAIYDETCICSKKFDFLNYDLPKKHEAFTKGKSCILEIAQKECEVPAVEFLKKRYNEFVEELTVKPTRNNNCTGLHYEMNKFQCIPFELKLKEKMDELKTNDVPMNDTRVPKVVDHCRLTEKCINQNCLFDENLKKDVKDACDVLDLASSSFSVCLNKIIKEKPDLKKYTCLKGINFYNENKNNVCEKFHLKADCMKTLMADYCGKEKTGDYQKMVDILMKKFKC